MITKITDKNSAKYNALFQDAQNALPDNGGEINDLHSYFANIADLGALIANDETAIRYIILPLDEDPIHIDANSRKIEIDKSEYFRKNGAGVAKDHTAEIVYFEIDRYFDNVDLAE
jgi:hypothetical protein